MRLAPAQRPRRTHQSFSALTLDRCLIRLSWVLALMLSETKMCFLCRSGPAVAGHIDTLHGISLLLWPRRRALYLYLNILQDDNMGTMSSIVQ